MLELNNFIKLPLFETLQATDISTSGNLYRDIVKMASKVSSTSTSYITTETGSGLKVVVLAPAVQENGSKTISIDFNDTGILIRYKVHKDAEQFFEDGYNTININIDSIKKFKLKKESFKAGNSVISFELESIKESKPFYTF